MTGSASVHTSKEHSLHLLECWLGQRDCKEGDHFSACRGGTLTRKWTIPEDLLLWDSTFGDQFTLWLHVINTYPPHEALILRIILLTNNMLRRFLTLGSKSNDGVRWWHTWWVRMLLKSPRIKWSSIWIIIATNMVIQVLCVTPFTTMNKQCSL